MSNYLEHKLLVCYLKLQLALIATDKKVDSVLLSSQTACVGYFLWLVSFDVAAVDQMNQQILSAMK